MRKRGQQLDSHVCGGFVSESKEGTDMVAEKQEAGRNICKMERVHA